MKELKKLAHVLTRSWYACGFGEDGGKPCLAVDSPNVGMCWTVRHDTDRYDVHLGTEPLRYTGYYFESFRNVILSNLKENLTDGYSKI